MINRRSGKQPICRFCECGDHAFIAATQWGIVLVSMQDCGFLMLFNWALTEPRKKTFYVRSEAFARATFTSGYLHRAILFNAVVVDHKNSNGLDNRRSNLRNATYSQNIISGRRYSGSSQYRGVNINRGRGKPWKAAIKFQRRSIHLGFFDSEQEAAMAYDYKAVELYGEFARLNFAPITPNVMRAVHGGHHYVGKIPRAST